MSDLTNTPKYGKATERFNAERELGRRVLEILRERAEMFGGQGPLVDMTLKGLPLARSIMDHTAFATVFDAVTARLVISAARALGLLPEPGK